MRRPFHLMAAIAACLWIVAAPALAETRLGLVIANSGYPAGAPKTVANDGALIGETLRSVGFDVTEGRDLDQTTLRRTLRDFAARIDEAGDDSVVFIYFAGHALQLAGANYLLPVDARLERPADVAAESQSLDALLSDLAATKNKLRFIVIDAATEHPFVAQAKLARGLALVEPRPDTLIAFSAAPGETAPEQTGDYGVYAQALYEMLRQPGLSAEDVFSRVKLRVHENTRGAATPFHVSTVPETFRFLEPAEPAPVASAPAPRAAPMRERDAAGAYALAIERDTIRDYQEFIALYPDDPLTRKIRARLARKREALAWRRATQQRTREAYWTYRKWYPRGPHYDDAGYELIAIGAPLAPETGFLEPRWDEIAPPPREEEIYFEETRGPVVYEEIAPPPLPRDFLPPPPDYYVPPPPPRASPGVGLLPLVGLAAIPAIAILPRLVRPPARRDVRPQLPPRAGIPPPVMINPPTPGGRPPGFGAPGSGGPPRAPVGAIPGQPPQALPGQIAPRPPIGALPPGQTPGRPVGPGQIRPPVTAVPVAPTTPLQPGQPAARPAAGQPPGRPPVATVPGQPPVMAPGQPVRPGGSPPGQGALQPRPPLARPPTPAIVAPRPVTRPPVATPPGLTARPSVGPAPALRPRPAPQIVRPAPQIVRPAPQIVRPAPQIVRPVAPAPVVRQVAPPAFRPPAPQIVRPAAPVFRPPPVARPAPPAQPRPAQQRPRCGPGQSPPACVR